MVFCCVFLLFFKMAGQNNVWENQHVFQINQEPARSSFIPFVILRMIESFLWMGYGNSIGLRLPKIALSIFIKPISTIRSGLIFSFRQIGKSMALEPPSMLVRDTHLKYNLR